LVETGWGCVGGLFCEVERRASVLRSVLSEFGFLRISFSSSFAGTGRWISWVWCLYNIIIIYQNRLLLSIIQRCGLFSLALVRRSWNVEVVIEVINVMPCSIVLWSRLLHRCHDFPMRHAQEAFTSTSAPSSAFRSIALTFLLLSLPISASSSLLLSKHSTYPRSAQTLFG
jgi:hypothetical protein